MLRRWHLFEFCDQPWWPAGLRRMLTDYLQTAMELVQPFRPRNDLLVRALRETGTSSVVDLCSGGAGPWVQLVRDLRTATGRPISVILTDKFPDPAAPGRLGRLDGIRYHLDSIDALAVSPELDGVRTVFNALHHFRPAQASAILADAVRQGRAIIVFEALNRSWPNLLCINLTPLMLWLVTPRIHPRTWYRTVFTYFLPIGTLAIWWDAVVSTLRCYTPDELLEMARAVDGGQYTWEAGTYRENNVPVTFLAGFPKAPVPTSPAAPQHAAQSTGRD
ncbi:MAG: hypothetical protein AB7O59_08695 [Pirellulales bacterium]